MPADITHAILSLVFHWLWVGLAVALLALLWRRFR